MVDLFSIGFLKVTLLDVIDVSIVAFIIYKLYKWLKGTVGSQIFLGLLIVMAFSFGAQLLNLKALNWLLKFITDIWVITFIILFQPEIRRLLVLIARTPFLRKNTTSTETPGYVNEIVEAAFEMSQHQHGALIIVVQSSGIRGFNETGEILNARLSKDLLRAIFYPRAALHDGAVVVKNDVIEAARCTMPLSTTTTYNGDPLGMRHRAGLGISEQADVLSVIVSEETGSISIAENGVLERGLSRDALRKRLSGSHEPSFLFKAKKSVEGLLKKQK
jgi:diadenylate cyclase